MRAFTRLDAPPVLNTPTGKKNPTPKWVNFGNRYSANRSKKPGFEFQWPTVEKQPLNQHLLPTLQAQTVFHCSYCDSHPLPKGSRTIDHFLPKSRVEFFGQVCQWENLYYACGHCQDSKGERYDPLILRPDEQGYSFSRYFIDDFDKHQIDCNPRASAEDQARAKATRLFFDFDEPALVTSRERSFKLYNLMEANGESPVLDDFNFRFMFDF